MIEHFASTMGPLKTKFNPRCVLVATGLLALASLCGCSRSQAQPRRRSEACGALAQSLANQENAFVARAHAIRAQHILLQDYDRQMIALIGERRKSIESALSLTAVPADEGVSGCSGGQLESLRLEALKERVLLQSYLNTFRRSLQEDPAGVFIDTR